MAKALYCGSCATYGHSARRCANAKRRKALLQRDTSCSETVYPCEFPPANFFEVENDEASIKAALVVNGGTPMICQEKGKRELKEYGENKKRLAELVTEHGGVLVLRGEGPKKTAASKR